MRIVENFPPPPPKPLRTFTLDMSERELRQVRLALFRLTSDEPDLTVSLTSVIDIALHD